ncbi:MAG: peptidoglycan-binding protein [Marinobacterium sp.]|nr:peptidoglycan-binding protein [Marinobacterium sp.]
MKKKILMLFSACIFTILTGCQEIKPSLNLEEDIPVQKATQFSDALKNIGDLIQMYDGRKVYLTVEPIENKTAALGQLPNDITMMVESSLNKIGKQVVVIPYMDSAITRYIERGHPVYVVHGAITEFDANTSISSNGMNLGLFAGEADGEGGYRDRAAISSITLDFTLMDVRKLSYVSGVQVSNSMKIHEASSSRDIGFSIGGNGFGINGSTSKKQGVHSIIRLLVELSMVEVIGQLRDYPYWVTIYNGQLDRKVITKLTTEFENFSKREKTLRIQKVLKMLGHRISVDGQFGSQTRKKIRNFQKKRHAEDLSGDPTSDVYVALMRELSDQMNN